MNRYLPRYWNALLAKVVAADKTKVGVGDLVKPVCETVASLGELELNCGHDRVIVGGWKEISARERVRVVRQRGKGHAR
jgi:hypothetical protein